MRPRESFESEKEYQSARDAYQRAVQDRQDSWKHHDAVMIVMGGIFVFVIWAAVSSIVYWEAGLVRLIQVHLGIFCLVGFIIIAIKWVEKRL